MCRGVKTPPYNARSTTHKPVDRRCHNVRRAAYMRPLQCEGNAIQTVNRRHGRRFAGGIYAAPTHGPNAVATKKPRHKINRHGGVKTPPYKAGYAPYAPAAGSVQRRKRPPTLAGQGGFTRQTAGWKGSGRRCRAAARRWFCPRSAAVWRPGGPPTAPRRKRCPPARPLCGPAGGLRRRRRPR